MQPFTMIAAIFLTVGAMCLLVACGGGDSAATASPPTANYLSLYNSGNGVYAIQGTGLSNVAAIELTLRYDGANMSAPTVALGSLASGAMLAANSFTAGTIKIAMVSSRALSGSGPIATISFAVDTGAGTIAISSCNLFNSSGTSITPNTGSTGGGTSSAGSGPGTGPATPIDSTGSGAATAVPAN